MRRVRATRHPSAHARLPRLAARSRGLAPCAPRRTQVAIAVMRSAGGHGSREDRAESLAKGLHDAWGVGDACGSGLLLLVAVDDRQACLHAARTRAPDPALTCLSSSGVHQHWRFRLCRCAGRVA